MDWISIAFGLGVFVAIVAAAGLLIIVQVADMQDDGGRLDE